MKRMWLLVVAVIGCHPLSTHGAPGGAQTVALPLGPQGKEAYICSCQPNVNSPAGDPTHVWVGRLPNCEEAFLIKFDLAALPPNAEVTSAVLEIFCDYHYGEKVGAIVFKRATGDWNAGTVCWAQPPTAAEDDRTSAPWPTGQTWHKVNVTKVVQGWRSGAFPNHGLLVTSTATPGRTCSSGFFANANGNASLRPRLRVAYVEKAGARATALYR